MALVVGSLGLVGLSVGVGDLVGAGVRIVVEDDDEEEVEEEEEEEEDKEEEEVAVCEAADLGMVGSSVCISSLGSPP